ncbi:MAG: AlpA family transcriptional regulator [Pseudomonadales bacterium]
MATENTSLLRLSEVVKITGLAKATIYAKVANNTFPAPIKLSERASAWIDQEIEQWVQDRISFSRNNTAA